MTDGIHLNGECATCGRRWGAFVSGAELATLADGGDAVHRDMPCGHAVRITARDATALRDLARAAIRAAKGKRE